MTDQDRETLVRNSLETMFKEVYEVKFIERKEYNIENMERSVYWIYGFRVSQEDSFLTHAATIGLDGMIDVRLHRLRATSPTREENILQRVKLLAENYITVSDNDDKMITRNIIRNFGYFPTEIEIISEVEQFYNNN